MYVCIYIYLCVCNLFSINDKKCTSSLKLHNDKNTVYGVKRNTTYTKLLQIDLR